MRRLLLILFAIAVAAAGFGFASALRDPVVAHYRVALPGLERPLRIVQLSDSHASAIDMRPARLRRVVAMINARHPDLILLSGDYVSGRPDRWSIAETAGALAPFKALQAPLGVYAVLGNHDDQLKTAAALRDGPVRLLVGQAVDLPALRIAGIDDIGGGNAAIARMRALIAATPPGQALLVLAHEPNFFTWSGERPLLMVTGHTHGGQIHVPFYGYWLPDAFLAAHRRGLFRERGQILLVSSGLGTSFLPLRIDVPPEITEIELVPVRASPPSLRPVPLRDRRAASGAAGQSPETASRR